ncbi:hypothetical protein I7I48_04436 [Histoplasma ohiense]|nr:hypothetical protein I7I48_04436 [Histoplasma ohiense (nom. inval.)]
MTFAAYVADFRENESHSEATYLEWTEREKWQIEVPFQPVVLDAIITATNRDKRLPENGLNRIWKGLYDGT